MGSDRSGSESKAWKAVAPTALGWDRAGLERLATHAASNEDVAILVMDRGSIVFERYWDGGDVHRGYDVASVQKTVVALLCGIARAEGSLVFDGTVRSYLGDGARGAGDVTVRQLITMTSG